MQILRQIKLGEKGSQTQEKFSVNTSVTIVINTLVKVQVIGPLQCFLKTWIFLIWKMGMITTALPTSQNCYNRYKMCENVLQIVQYSLNVICINLLLLLFLCYRL